MLFQANELLQRSRQVQNKSEKEKMLRESLKEYQKISTQVDLANVCVQYRQGKMQLFAEKLPHHLFISAIARVIKCVSTETDLLN